ncbi:hypothetical protein WQ54_05570 [Bacillus sp. SA1-12]|uniref:hypothetical protein n=1 Tax=Bacillus sp. SA1-12 TaxID=1455638 RepID=UPI00062550B0|nr:hypothetical protein [Bacillus sp. SA1-12]KKI92980.1 hypothetical protein WQ54_05570 [Bacillus sp. SA1-12]
MHKKRIRIGEHLILVTSDSINVISMFDRNFYIEEDNNLIPDLFLHIEDGYGVPFVNYQVSIINTENHISFKRADYNIKVDLNYKSATIFVHNELALKHALMNLYSSFIVHHNWGILLHSSCVLDKGSAHIFSGQSGAGKSTAAKLSFPRELLSDEATIIKITSNEIMVYDSPFRSELKGNGHSQPHILESIQLLHQSLHNNRIRLSKSSGLITIIDKVFYWTDDPQDTIRILNLLKLLVNQVPVYDLHFQKNNTFWEMIS